MTGPASTQASTSQAASRPSSQPAFRGERIGDQKRAVISAQGADFLHDLVIDGKSVGRYYAVAQVIFSPDEKHVAWVAARKQPMMIGDGGGYDVWVDGKQFEAKFRYVADNTMGQTAGFMFSPDSQRWAVLGQVFSSEEDNRLNHFNGGVGGYAVMVDGKMGPTFTAIVKNTLQFTADSKSVIYAAGTPRKQDYAIYRDGVAGKKWNWIGPGSIKFSPDGKHIAYTAFTGEQVGRFTGDDPTPAGMNSTWYAGIPAFVKDDEVVEPSGGFFRFSADWSHVVWLRMKMQNPSNGPIKAVLIADGQEAVGLGTDARLKSIVFSPSGQRFVALLHYSTFGRVAIDGKMYRFDSGIDASDAVCTESGPVLLYIGSSAGDRWMQFDPTGGRVAIPAP
jgi:hypothetical protein